MAYRIQSFFCQQCEQTVTGTTKQHNGSVYHRQHRRIRALLKKSCITYQEIARRVGVSREYIRLIDERMLGGTGTERHITCAIAKGPYPLPENCFAVQAQKACAQHNLGFAFIETKSRTLRPILSRKTVKINSNVCVLNSAHARPNGTIVLFRPRTKAAAFALARLDDGRWMIIPKNKWPKKQTAFVENPVENKRAYSFRHDWQSYIEAWHLLDNSLLLQKEEK